MLATTTIIAMLKRPALLLANVKFQFDSIMNIAAMVVVSEYFYVYNTIQMRYIRQII